MCVKEATLGTCVLDLSTANHTYVDMLGPHASFGGIPTPRISVSGETLARGTRAVYPFDRLRKRVDQWTFLLVCVGVGHSNM